MAPSMMINGYEVGPPVATVFYSRTLHRIRPGHTCAFYANGVSLVANFLWRVEGMDLAKCGAQRVFSDAHFRGFLTEDNRLITLPDARILSALGKVNPLNRAGPGLLVRSLRPQPPIYSALAVSRQGPRME